MSETRNSEDAGASYSTVSTVVEPTIFQQENIVKEPPRIKTLEELYVALEVSRKQYENGQVIDWEDMKEYWLKKTNGRVCIK
jgi:hypothetical protein